MKKSFFKKIAVIGLLVLSLTCFTGCRFDLKKLENLFNPSKITSTMIIQAKSNVEFNTTNVYASVSGKTTDKNSENWICDENGDKLVLYIDSASEESSFSVGTVNLSKECTTASYTIFIKNIFADSSIIGVSAQQLPQSQDNLNVSVTVSSGQDFGQITINADQTVSITVSAQIIDVTKSVSINLSMILNLYRL